MDGDIVRNYSGQMIVPDFGYNAGLLVLNENEILHGGTFLKVLKKMVIYTLKL